MGNLLEDLLLEKVTLNAPIAISANIYLAKLTSLPLNFETVFLCVVIALYSGMVSNSVTFQFLPPSTTTFWHLAA